MKVYLTAPRYALGEIEEDHTALVDLPDRIARLRILPKADLWGWGKIRRTERGLAALAVESGSATLRAAGTGSASVDAVVLCSTSFPEGTGSHAPLLRAVLSGLGLDDVDVFGITLNACTNLLAGLQVADALVAGGRYSRVLVISCDQVRDGTSRLEKFALFSDGAASCVVTAEPGGFHIVACAAAHNIQEFGWANEINSGLARTVNERLLKSTGMTLDDVSGLMHANIFRPIVVLKEMQAGFARNQLHTDNIERIGHCFGADPVINLVDRAAAGEVRDDHHYMLASSVPGSRIGILLRKVPDQP